MTKLKVIDLHKSFNHHPVLQGITFEAKKGDVIALMGSSGSGKSTLLRCINLLIQPDTGVIQIDEEIMRFDREHLLKLSNAQMIALRKKVGMVFQHFNLWAHMTVLDNLIAAPVYVLKQNKVEAINAARALLKKVGLANKEQAYPSRLSGGQQQRAAIARALMMKPEIMLFDEPTSSLDPEMVGEVLNVMRELALEGMTMLVATHELGFAKHVATYSMFLDAGKIVEHGDTIPMFTHPKTERFQRFLAAMKH